MLALIFLLSALLSPAIAETQPDHRGRLDEYRPVRSVPASRLEGSAPAILPDLVGRWVAGFTALQHQVTVQVPPPYEPPQGALSSRLSAFLTGRLDFAFLSRSIATSDVAAFRRSHGYDPLVIPVANGSWNRFGFVDPVAIVVNVSNPVRGLSFAQIDALLSRSRRRGYAPIRRWGDVGVRAWRASPVHIVGADSWTKEDSARAAVVRERILLGGAWRQDLAGSGSEADVPSRVAADRLAIGFTGLGHLVPGVRAVAISAGKTGEFVDPTYAAVAGGRYPLARTIDLVVARPPGRCLKPELREFIRFMLSREGQQAVIDQGAFLPLMAAQARLSWRRASRCGDPEARGREP
ncbi:MAG: hypothetical protein JWO25_306 [Alphaproteobacteria bacterium]|nr:hypothetical protein [Alphaproteobacteria bacterium]